MTDQEHKHATLTAVDDAFKRKKKEELDRIKEELLEAKKRDDAQLLRQNGIELQNLSQTDFLSGGFDQSEVLLMTQPKWRKDSSVSRCHRLECGIPFSAMRRRHHCRLCGEIFCDSCSSNRALLPLRFPSRKPERVCIMCFGKLAPVQDVLIRLKALKNRKNSKYDWDHKNKVRSYINSPVKHTLSGEIRKAAYSVHNLFNPASIHDRGIPCWILRKARGLVFITIMKCGFLASVRIGSGLVLAKLPDGSWSAPSAIYTAGVGFGAQVGGHITDFVSVLFSDEDLENFMGSTMARLGGQASLCAGTGRAAEGNMHMSNRPGAKASKAFSYAHSRGIFAGVSLEMGAIRTRHRVNEKFYGYKVKPGALLRGEVPPPVAAQPIYDELGSAEAILKKRMSTVRASSSTTKSPPPFRSQDTPPRNKNM